MKYIKIIFNWALNEHELDKKKYSYRTFNVSVDSMWRFHAIGSLIVTTKIEKIENMSCKTADSYANMTKCAGKVKRRV